MATVPVDYSAASVGTWVPICVGPKEVLLAASDTFDFLWATAVPDPTAMAYSRLAGRDLSARVPSGETLYVRCPRPCRFARTEDDLA